MARFGRKQIAVWVAGLAGIVVPLEVAAAVGAGPDVPAAPFLFEVLIAGSVAGALLLLDTTSWSLMTSRR